MPWCVLKLKRWPVSIFPAVAVKQFEHRSVGAEFEGETEVNNV